MNLWDGRFSKDKNKLMEDFKKARGRGYCFAKENLLK